MNAMRVNLTQMDKELETLGIQIDDAAAEKNIPALNALLEKCSDVLITATGQNKLILYFFKANCYSTLANVQSSNPDYRWSWKQDVRVSELLELRKAVSEDGFSELAPIFQCKILTNLGNNLNFLGRFIDAIKSWDAALQCIPNFAMALGSKGVGLIYYGHSLYDRSHSGIMIAHARNDLNKSVAEGSLWDSGIDQDAKNHFNSHLDYATKYLQGINYNFEFDLDQWGLGEGKEEIDYRRWCLHHRLFLSPLNDVGRYTAAAQDVIHLPDHTYNIFEDPRFPKYFNLLKQEYVTARYMLFDAINSNSDHISDKGVLLINNFDGVQFSYHSEQLKTAYRLVYSLFDKIALFLNDYFSIGLEADKVNFRNIWGKKINEAFELSHCFEKSKNWPLRGLYYLSKDLFDESFIDVSLPDAQELASLRHRIEHRFLSLQDYGGSIENTDVHSYALITDFEEKTLRIISMAREALIYLSLAMHREEKIRNKEKRRDKLVVPIQSIIIKR